MKIHVICCNNEVEFAVVDDESKAIEKLKELAEEDFLKNIHVFDDRQEYKNRCHWHIYTVAGA
jgi:hypothetical protein